MGFLVLWASFVVQLIKNLHAMWETWAQFLGWEDLLEKGKATHSSILDWRIPWTIPHVQGKRNPSKTVGVVRGHQKADTLKP